MPDLDAVILRITRKPFRAGFHLRSAELAQVRERGLDTVRAHARELIRARLAPAHPANDGKQTPWGGHPVFRAQHASATCCRRCLRVNHGIMEGEPLTPEQQDYVVDVICRWIELEERSLAGAQLDVPVQGTLELDLNENRASR